jgi:tetratricopeptide (TPR) repeat protein
MSGDQQIYQNAMNQGHSAAWEQDWEKAASYYRLALDEFPENFNALTSQALAFYELHRYPESLQYYQRANMVSPGDPLPVQKIAEIEELSGHTDLAVKAHLEVAELFARKKDIDKAIQSWSRVTSLSPENMTAHMRLAIVYEHMGQGSNAMVEYIAIASLLQEQGNLPKAIQTMQHALEVVPDNKEATFALASLQSGKPLPRPARQPGTMPYKASFPAPPEVVREDVERTRIDPIQDARQKATTMLADLLFEQEEAQAPQQRKGLTSIMLGRGDEDHGQGDQSKLVLHLSQAIDLQSHGQEQEAANDLERAIQAGLDNSAAYFLLGFLQSKNEQFEAAVINLRKAVQHELLGFGARLLLALTLYKIDQVKEASIEYLRALRIADALSVPADQAEELMQLYEPLIDTFSSQSDLRLQKRICENISKMLIRTDWRTQTQIARQQLPAQPQGSPPTPLAEMLTEATSGQLVESLAKINQLARANKLLSAMEEAYYAIKFAPSYLPLHVCIGDLLYQENRIPEAVMKYSIVARSYSVRGETNRAISLLQRVCEINPTDLEARNNLIDMLASNGKPTDTVNEYVKLAEAYYNMADLAMARQTYTNAYRFSQQSKVDRDTRVKLLHRMADIDMQSLDWRNAIRVFEQIRTMVPEDSEARDMLFTLNLRLGQTDQAMSELDNYLNHLISVHRTTEALDYLNSKIQENPSQPTLYRRLAELYRLLGRKEDAITQMEISKDLYLQADNLPAAIETLMTIVALNPANVRYYQHMLVELQEKEKTSK